MPPKNDQEGMTLLEALVALAIVALAMTGLTDALYSTGHAARRTTFEIRAALDAQSLMARLSMEKSLDGLDRRGAFADGLTWILDVAPLDPNPRGASNLVSGRVVKVAVSDGSDDTKFVFQTILIETAP